MYASGIPAARLTQASGQATALAAVERQAASLRDRGFTAIKVAVGVD